MNSDRIIILKNVLDVNVFHHLAKTVDLRQQGGIGDRFMLLTENDKHRFLLPVTNYGGFNHDWYTLVLYHPSAATKLKTFFDSLDSKTPANIYQQWMYRAIAASVPCYSSEDFGEQFCALSQIVEQITIYSKH